MKYTKQALHVLTNNLKNLIDQCFRFEMQSQDINKEIIKFIDSHMLTATGKKRYPDYYSTALHNFAAEFKQVRMNEKTLFCYLVDGELYTTYKKSASWYVGEVTLKSYRQDPAIEQKVLYSKGDITNGFYYNSGKPFFVKHVA